MSSDNIDVTLLPHNEEAYQKLIEGLKDKQFVSINHATGTGKSFIMLKYLLNNRDKRILYLAPNYAILDQLVNEHIEELGLDKKAFKKLDMMIYSSLLRKNVKEMADNYDIVILDEYHRCGAEQWGEKIDELIGTIRDKGMDTKVIGTTATEIRYLDNKKNMNEILFDGNCVSRLSLSEAMIREILPVPVYVNASYELMNKLTIVENRIKRSNLSDRVKEAIYLQIYKVQREIEDTMKSEKGIREFVQENGKYIVFSSKIDNFYKDQLTIESILGHVDNVYMVSSDESRKNNLRYLREFRNAPSNETTVLYSVNLLNEGVHVKDVDAVFMLRATSSPIIYFQQLGRLLSYSKRKDRVVVFDLVNNYQKHDAIYQVYTEVASRARELIISDPDNRERYERILNNFKIVDYSSKICQKIDELDKKYSPYNIAMLTLDETIELLEESIDFKDADVYFGYLNLFRYQKYATIEMYDRVSKLDIEKPGVFASSREEFIKYLAGYKNIYQKNANKYKDLYKEVLDFYDRGYQLPGVFSKDKEERELAKKLLEGFDKFTAKMQSKIKECVDDNLSVVEKISYGVEKLPSDRRELYKEMDKLFEDGVMLGYNLISILRLGSERDDKKYLIKAMASNDKLSKKIFDKEDEMEDNANLLKKRFGTRREIIYREKFFMVADNVRKEFNSCQDKEEYIKRLVNDITNFLVDNKRKIRFNRGEEISYEDILFIKKVIFSEYLKDNDFDKMLERLTKPKKVNFDDLFIFMDSHMGCLPIVKSEDKMEQILAKRYNKHKDEMTFRDQVKFSKCIKEHAKERYDLVSEYLNFINTYGRRPLPFNEDEKYLHDSFERVRTVLPEDYLRKIDKLLRRLDPKIEIDAINNHIIKRSQK